MKGRGDIWTRGMVWLWTQGPASHSIQFHKRATKMRWHEPVMTRTAGPLNGTRQTWNHSWNSASTPCPTFRGKPCCCSFRCVLQAGEGGKAPRQELPVQTSHPPGVMPGPLPSGGSSELMHVARVWSNWPQEAHQPSTVQDNSTGHLKKHWKSYGNKQLNTFVFPVINVIELKSTKPPA